MKMFCISDTLDISLGLRLSGIEYVILEKRDEVLEKLDELLKDKDYGIIILTDEIYKLVSDKIEILEKKKNIPLYIKIPEIEDKKNE